ncbi:MAG TPA: universal stress protein [Streptosporangiaceae bacterium]|nr:universal stress protein [Streptosporangiaceae bacterium]
MRAITVGVDGSGHAHQALEWSVREAGVQHAALHVVTVHPVATNHWTGKPVTYPADEGAVAEARQAAADAVNKAVAECGEPHPASVSVMAVNGVAAQELVKASRDSDLLVVGARGGGGFSRMALGSVSSQVLQHAECPVVVVRHGHEA